MAKCPICGSEYGTRIAHKDRYGFDATFTLCHRCSLIYLDPVASEEEYAKFYDGDYRKLTVDYRGQQDIEKNQCRYGAALAQFIGHTIGRVKSVLDIGGSTGLVAKQIEILNPGVDITVVEYNSKELAKARAMGFRTIQGGIAEIPDEHFDLVLLCRSIDHVAKPLHAMTAIWRTINDDGYAYVDHCDWRLVAQAEGFTKALHIDHPSNFTRESFNRLLSYSGLFPVAEYVPPMSSCYGYLLRRGFLKHSHYQSDLLADIRSFQAEERKCQKSAY